MRRLLPLLVIVVTAVPVVLLWARAPGANGPAEWQWPYREAGLVAVPSGLLLALAILLVVLALTLPGRGEPPRGRGAVRLTLFVSILTSATFTLALIASLPDGFTWVFRALVSRDDFGFVWDAGLAPATG